MFGQGREYKMNLETIGIGGGSGLLGVVLTFFGFKSRLDGIESKLNHVVFDDTCKATVGGLEKQMKIQTDLMMETRKDVKELLKRK